MTDAPLKITLGIGLLLGVAAVGVTLAQSPLTVTRVNVADHAVLGIARRTLDVCQSNEALPAGTSAIRLRVEAFYGPRVAVEVLAGEQAVAHGERGSGWTGGAVTIPVSPLATARSGVDLCFALYLGGEESCLLVGQPMTGALAARSGDEPLPGRVGVEYLRSGRTSWWSLAPAVARRMGLGHALTGVWDALLALTLTSAVALLCAGLILRRLQ